MANNFVQVQPNSTGLKLDTSELVVGANTVERQVIVVADPTLATGMAKVDASGNQYVVVSSSVAIGGVLLAMPTATANGAALTAGPTGTEISIPPGASVSYTIASSAPAAPPTAYRVIANPAGASGYIIDQINLASGNVVYVTTAATVTVTLPTVYRTI